MPVDSLERPELGIGNEPPLRLAIGRREEHVRRHRHYESLGFNSTQRGPQVPAGVAADVAPLPLPRHVDEIVRIHDAEIAIHEVDDEIVEG